jgi:hypothetical protein
MTQGRCVTETRGTTTVNHDSGVGANEKNHGTTAAQHA